MTNVMQRGFIIEKMLGANLPRTFKTFDKFKQGVATSIKSIDLTAKTYLKENQLYNKVKGFVNEAKNFQSYSMTDAAGNLVSLDASQIQSRAVELAIQPGKATLDQWEQLGKAMDYGKQNGVKVNISFIK
jgi:hypothetical protein